MVRLKKKSQNDAFESVEHREPVTEGNMGTPRKRQKGGLCEYQFSQTS